MKNLKSSFHSCNKSLINQACSGPYWENIGPRSFLYGPSCARSVLSRPRADILPVRPSRLVNKIYIKRNFPPKKNFKWPENRVKFRGALISTDPTATLKLNYTEKVNKMRNILSCWEYRRLTLIGKIQVIKRLALSQLTSILTPLATSQKCINEVNDIFIVFCNWNNKLSCCVKFL